MSLILTLVSHPTTSFPSTTNMSKYYYIYERERKIEVRVAGISRSRGKTHENFCGLENVPNVVGTRHLMEWTPASAPQSRTNLALLAT